MNDTAITTPGDRIRFGHFLKCFVFGEVLKLAGSADDDYQIGYYRDHDRFEVDYVVENSAGWVAGVEVKAAATVKENDLKGIRRLAKAAGERWLCGIILYDGDMTLPLGMNIWAAPLSTLWGRKSRAPQSHVLFAPDPAAGPGPGESGRYIPAWTRPWPDAPSHSLVFLTETEE